MVLVPGHVGPGKRIGPDQWRADGRPLHVFTADRRFPDADLGDCGANGGLAFAPKVLAVAAGVTLAACAAETRYQLGFWQDSMSLFGRALKLDPGNEIALNNYCLALFDHRKYEEAAVLLTNALKSKPKLVPALLQLGMARNFQGRPNEAMQAFAEAVKDALTTPKPIIIWVTCSSSRAETKQRRGNCKPPCGWSLTMEAPLSTWRTPAGKWAGPPTRWVITGTIRLQPDSLEPLNTLAWLLATSPDPHLRNGSEAVSLASRACELTQYGHPLALSTLAAACAEAGRLQEAMGYAEQAQALLRGRPGPLTAQLSRDPRGFSRRARLSCPVLSLALCCQPMRRRRISLSCCPGSKRSPGD